MSSTRSRRLLGAGATLALAAPLFLAAPTSAEPVAHAAGAPRVTIVGSAAGFAFSPAKVKINAGRRVNWSWSGSAQHNVVFTSGPSSATTNTGSFSRKFSAPGKYTYVCTVHGFTGKVVVK